MMTAMSIVVRVLAVLMAVFLAPAHAAGEKQYRYNDYPWRSSFAAACEDARAELKKTTPGNPLRVKKSSLSIPQCDIEGQDPQNGNWLQWATFGINERTKPDSTCEDGNIDQFEFKIGWARYFDTPDGGTIPLKNGTASVTPLPPQAPTPLEVCSAGCRWYYEGNEDKWVDPGAIDQGNVPRYASADYKSSDIQCTEPTDRDLAGENPGPPETDPGDPDDDNPDGDNDPGGGNSENPGGGSSDGPDHNTGDGGDPGDDDANGPGGGNNENPAEAQCGVPGKPACTATIDETGTPSGPGDKMDTGKIGEQFDKLRDQLDRIKDKGDKDTSWGLFPSWFRTGSCQPWSFGAFGATTLSIDYCPAVPYAQGAASFMWLVVTFFAVTGMVSRTLGGGARS